MKILVVCQHYWPEPFNTSDVCEELVKRGHNVSVITGLPNTGMPNSDIPEEYKDDMRKPLGPPPPRRSFFPRARGATMGFEYRPVR